MSRYEAAIRYVVGMIVQGTFRETRTEKKFRKGATFFRTGFLFRTGDIFDQQSLALEASLQPAVPSAIARVGVRIPVFGLRLRTAVTFRRFDQLFSLALSSARCFSRRSKLQQNSVRLSRVDLTDCGARYGETCDLEASVVVAWRQSGRQPRAWLQ